MAVMTIRERLNRRIVPTYVVMLACFVLFVAGGLGATAFPLLIGLVFVSFAGFGACTLFLHFGVRCPKCHERIAGLVFLPRGGYFRLSKAVRFCPFCGVSMDSEVGGAYCGAPETARR
jgi:hypothetical protein